MDHDFHSKAPHHEAMILNEFRLSQVIGSVGTYRTSLSRLLLTNFSMHLRSRKTYRNSDALLLGIVRRCVDRLK